jgi:hypothetical protein
MGPSAKSEPLPAEKDKAMSSNQSNFDHALTLIERMYRALSEADTHAQHVNKTLIQEAIDFLEKNGGGVPRFEG